MRGVGRVKPEGGFTLIEVMVAMAVLSFALVSALQLFAGSMRLAGNSVAHTKALMLGRSVMDEILWQAELEDLEVSDRTPDGYRWSAYVGPVAVALGATADDEGVGADSDEFELKQIIVRVDWEGVLGEKSIVLESARLAERY